MMKKADLILKNTDTLAGTPRILMRQANCLLRDGFDVSVISENFHPNLRIPEIKRQKTFKWPKATLFQRKFFDWQAQRKVREGSLVLGHGDSLHQDILFLHTATHLGAEVAPGPHNKKNLSIPFHRMIFEKGSFRQIVCVSHMLKNDIQKRFDIKVPMHVIYPGHDSQLVNKVDQRVVNDIRAQLKTQSNEVVVGVICSGDLGNRGAYATIAAFGELEESYKKRVKILIVGKEKYPQKVYQAAQAVGMGERILWLSARADVANVIRAADLVVHAANIEAAGITFLEFMALSRPVIATRTVGFAEILPDIQKDFVIERQDSGLIAGKLRELLDRQDQWNLMGEENRKIASTITWERYDERFMEVVRNFRTQNPVV
jgi:UDP-glucose:(heptosyl)LPS alpha-1,3-glucosyltransferase